MENLKYVLEMKNITKEFPGVKALDNVQLKLKPGTVHALMGENGAGKSTLMKCLFGIYEKDTGKILLDGVEVNFKSTKEALENGVSMVHQELNQVLQRNVLDNIWLGRYPMKGFFVDEKKMYEDTINIFKDLDIKVDPRKKVADLPIAERQMIEIAKAVSYKSKVIVMDEPTSSLTEKEVDHLFRIINRLKQSGVAIVYISHKMEEIKMISDEITILRDGKWISTNDVSKISTEQIISMMVGRDLTERFPKKDNTVKEMILEVKNLTALNQPSIQDVSFELYKGEILGIAGLVGSKRTEIVETIFGIRPKEKGEIILNGKTVKNKNPEDAIKNGFALVTEERRSTGIFSMLDIAFNSVISNLDRYKNKFRLLKNKDMEKDTKWIVDSMRVKTPSYTTKIGSLSGGNQQKAIIAREVDRNPDLLIVSQPTRGLDVGAIEYIHKRLIQERDNGKAVLVVSFELDEILNVSDRIAVIHDGKIQGIVTPETTNKQELGVLMAGGNLGEEKSNV